ncbi:hypothetical protein [uncultured Paraglaciecola sp.]|uniref:hypothetical protein n=1 Tax=uncultured Paraglaciecola sp. TaxID=1765024 RepID=UPI0026320DFF|nr:hypothetical protein [uncultured Paraglaciecola sp.]
MKITIFTICVLLAGYYLVSQTEAGSDLLSRYLPQQQIEQTAEQVKDKVDQSFEQLANKYAGAQNKKIEKLEQRVIELEQLFLVNKQPATHPESKLVTATEPENSKIVEYESAPALAPVDLGVVQLHPLAGNPKNALTVQPFEEFVEQQHSTIDSSAERKRKQGAALDDIAGRMELVSLQASGLTQ